MPPRKDYQTFNSHEVTQKSLSLKTSSITSLRASVLCSSQTRSGLTTDAVGAQARRAHDSHCLAQTRRQSGMAGSKGYYSSPSTASRGRRRHLWAWLILYGQSGGVKPDDEERWLRGYHFHPCGRKDYDRHNTSRMHRVRLGHRSGGEVFREAGEELAKAKRPQIESEMRAFFDSQERDDKGIWALTSSWVITARDPG